MWRRHLVSLLIVGATFFLLGCLSGEAVAQNGKPAFTTLTGQPAGPGDLAALFRRTPIPVRLYGLEGPDSLAVGEEGRFAAMNLCVAVAPRFPDVVPRPTGSMGQGWQNPKYCTVKSVAGPHTEIPHYVRDDVGGTVSLVAKTSYLRPVTA